MKNENVNERITLMSIKVFQSIFLCLRYLFSEEIRGMIATGTRTTKQEVERSQYHLFFFFFEKIKSHDFLLIFVTKNFCYLQKPLITPYL